jgi:hypothetical protein
MKKLIILCAVLAGCNLQAQDRGKRHYFSEMTPEQIATLGSKHLALALDLSQEQQNKVMELQLENINERRVLMQQRKSAVEDNDSIGPGTRFDRLNSRLDRQLAYKSEMKGILSEAQYAQWEKLHSGKGRHSAHHRWHHHRRGAKR